MIERKGDIPDPDFNQICKPTAADRHGEVTVTSTGRKVVKLGTRKPPQDRTK